MNWHVEFRPEVREDVAEAARWYEAREAGLGDEFVDEIFRVWDAIAENPLIGSRRHPMMDVRWRYPERFPFQGTPDDYRNRLPVRLGLASQLDLKRFRYFHCQSLHGKTSDIGGLARGQAGNLSFSFCGCDETILAIPDGVDRGAVIGAGEHRDTAVIS